MSRASGLILLAAGLLSAGAARAACPATAEAQAADLGWLLEVAAPCQPYAAVEIHYGAFRVFEELSVEGRLSLMLPDLQGRHVAQVVGLGATLRVELGDSPQAGGFLWLDAGDAELGLLPPLGLEGAGPRTELALFPKDAPPTVLNIPVTPTRCGELLEFALLRDGWDTPRDISLTLPDCALAGAVIRLPVPSE